MGQASGPQAITLGSDSGPWALTLAHWALTLAGGPRLWPLARMDGWMDEGWTKEKNSPPGLLSIWSQMAIFSYER